MCAIGKAGLRPASYLGLFLVTILSATSCSGTLGMLFSFFDSMTVRPLVASSVLTKSDGCSGISRIVSEGGVFEIEESVCPIDQPQTKGREILTSNFVSEYGRFMVNAFSDVERECFNDFNLATSYSGGAWIWDGYAKGEGPSWRNSVPMTFWGYAPVVADGRTTPSVRDWESGDLSHMYFSYEVPASLEDQKDLLFACNHETRSFTESEGKFVMDKDQTPSYSVKFNHALSAVKFTFDPKDMPGVDIKRITLSSLSMSGDCCVTGTSGDLSFVWTGLGTPEEVSYEFDDSHSVREGYMSTGSGVMLMIPQTRSEVRLKVQFKKGDSLVEKEQTIPVSWQAGMFYTYRLSAEIHVPGEAILLDTDLSGSKFMHGVKYSLLDTPLNVKGINKVGVVVSRYKLKQNDGNAILSSDREVFDSGRLPTVNPEDKAFYYNFQDVDVPTGAHVQYLTTCKFGLNGDSAEKYYPYYIIEKTNGFVNEMRYFVFDTSGTDTFNLCATTLSNNNGNEVSIHVVCIIALEVEGF